MEAKKKILITGSNGLLGQKLVKLIVEKNEYDLIATARGHNRLSNKDGYVFEQLNSANKENVYQVIEKYRPDYVIHTAAMTNVDQCEIEKEECWLQNVTAVQYIVSACKKFNFHLTHLSTDFIFDGLSGPYDESATPAPLSHYGESKLAAEKIVAESGMVAAIARTVLVYGIAEDMSRSNIILWVKKNLEEGKYINVVDDQERSPTLAEDLAQGCYLLVKNDSHGIFNIAGREILTPYQMAMKTAEFFNLDNSLITKTDSTKFKQTAVRPLKTGLLIDKAIMEIGYSPKSFVEGITVIASQFAD